MRKRRFHIVAALWALARDAHRLEPARDRCRRCAVASYSKLTNVFSAYAEEHDACDASWGYGHYDECDLGVPAEAWA